MRDLLAGKTEQHWIKESVWNLKKNFTKCHLMNVGAYNDQNTDYISTKLRQPAQISVQRFYFCSWIQPVAFTKIRIDDFNELIVKVNKNGQT